MRLAEELQFSVYNFEYAEVPRLWKHFKLYEAEARSCWSGRTELMASKTASVDGEEAVSGAGDV